MLVLCDSLKPGLLSFLLEQILHLFELETINIFQFYIIISY
jgi:hypothetical protein